MAIINLSAFVGSAAGSAEPTMIHATTKTLHNRREASAFLNGIGIDYSPVNLAVMATRGNGPFYRTLGRRAAYLPQDLAFLMESRLSTPRRITAGADVVGCLTSFD